MLKIGNYTLPIELESTGEIAQVGVNLRIPFLDMMGAVLAVVIGVLLVKAARKI